MFIEILKFDPNAKQSSQSFLPFASFGLGFLHAFKEVLVLLLKVVAHMVLFIRHIIKIVLQTLFILLNLGNSYSEEVDLLNGNQNRIRYV